MSSINNSTVAKQSKAIDKSIIAVAAIAMATLVSGFAISSLNTIL